MTETLFTLVPGRWYGWTMLPGYGGPYFAPVFVHALKPRRTGLGILHVRYVDPRYAEGVQSFERDLRVLQRTPTHLVAAIESQPDRTAILATLDRDWLKSCLPGLDLPDGDKTSIQEALLRRFTGAAREHHRAHNEAIS